MRPSEPIKIYSLIVYLMAVTAVAKAQALYKAENLKVEYLEHPLGIDAPAPRFSWTMKGSKSGTMQSSYRILVDTDSIAVVKGVGRYWDSGEIESGENLSFFKGQMLNPFTKYFWRVYVKDQDQKEAEAPAISFFETGTMQMKNWTGSWISDANDINIKPAPFFRKTFEAAKKVRSARAYISAAGLYELYINGNKIGNHRLDPMYTRFDRRNLYVTYDVTANLQAGKNAIGVLLGNGWYNHQSTAVWDFHKAPWRGRPAFCMDLRIVYEDGSREIISSGKDWKTSLSPVIFNSIYTAEHYDARKEQPGWNTAQFDDSKWKEVILRSAPSSNITAQALHPIRNVEQIKAKSIRRIDDTTYLFDLGRNIAGVSRLTVKGSAGTVIRLKHTERLDSTGRADMSNIDIHYRPTDNTDPFQTDIFILSGKGEETFMPHFNYKGFQYVEVTSNTPLSLTAQSLDGFFMHSDVPVAGYIRSSNPLIDKIWYATNNSYLSNLFGYPTDCPQREKNGWTGDAQIAIETGLYSFDGITVYEKWLADHRDEQQPNGVLPSIIPSNGWGYEWGNGPDWTSTIAIIPWNIYLFYGDKKLLTDCYDNIKRYVDHIDKISPGGLTTWGLGDWVPVKSKTPVELTSTCYYYADVTILAKTAKISGKVTDYEKYSTLADKIKKAFNEKYLDSKKAIYGSGVQTELSVPLFWGLVPDSLKGAVAANLARRVEADNFHLDVGLLGQKAILNALSENGYADVAYKIASQKSYPSWGWWIVNGATTLYENWNIKSKYDISLNHIMFGEIGAWLYKGLGGIKPDPSVPGFKNVILEPHFVEGLNQFEASHTGPYGPIVSSWSRSGKRLTYLVTIPPNSTASVRLPVKPDAAVTVDGRTSQGQNFNLSSGKHIFKFEIP